MDHVAHYRDDYYVVSQHYTVCFGVKKVADPFWLVALDAVISFILLPWGVVAFWRGFWYLMDLYLYLWDLTASKKDLHLSIIYSSLIGMDCLFITNEDFIQYIPMKFRIVLIQLC